ncbi:MAG: carbohydrate kinase family protein [Acidobacteria bacterium]|nr:carbohydrate kinase family protein [Acidobacteriota bacterium]
MVRVLGLGDAGVDVVLHIPRLPQHDEKILATRVERYPGGVIGNFLCALSRLGTASAFVGCLGNDGFGALVREGFDAFQVDTNRLIVKEGEETYFCVSMLDDTGEKALVIAPTTTMFPAPEDLTDDTVRGADLLHTTGLRIDTTLKAIALARRHGVKVSLDLEPSTLSRGEDRVRELLESSHLLFVNAHAIRGMFPGETDLRRAGLELLRHGPKMVVITQGGQGSLVVTATETIRTPAFPVAVRDTTGAGDCFNAAFIHGHLEGWALERTALFATAAAAISITAVGAQSGLPTRQAVDEFLQQRRAPRA